MQKAPDESVTQFLEKYENECRNIVTEVMDKFIDLNVGGEDYGQDTQQQQDQFEQLMEGMTVASKLLDLPTNASTKDNEDVIESEVLGRINAADTELGKEVDAIFRLVEDDKTPLTDQIVCHCVWDAAKKQFV